MAKKDTILVGGDIKEINRFLEAPLNGNAIVTEYIDVAKVLSQRKAARCTNLVFDARLEKFGLSQSRLVGIITQICWATDKTVIILTSENRAPFFRYNMLGRPRTSVIVP